MNVCMEMSLGRPQFIRIFGYIVELFKGEALLRVVKRPTCYRGLPSLMVFYSVKFL